MARALVLLAEGFEEIEGITVVDVLRRGGVEVTTAALGPGPVRGAHGIEVTPDSTLDHAVAAAGAYDAVVLPGGNPGYTNLAKDPRVLGLLKTFQKERKTVAAVCAAPWVLQKAGLLDGKRATIHPSLRAELTAATHVESPVVEDGTVVTSQGAGTTMAFALKLVERLVGREKAREVAERLVFRGPGAA
jgi:4-methyl-5(b-hydroxyethyl)-thiazole monophosphate biosynthesis